MVVASLLKQTKSLVCKGRQLWSTRAGYSSPMEMICGEADLRFKYGKRGAVGVAHNTMRVS